MAGSNVAYKYNDPENYDYHEDDPLESHEEKSNAENARKKIELKKSTSVHENKEQVVESKNGSVLTIIFVSLMAAVLFGSVIYTLDSRNTVYNKVTSLNKQLSLAEAENVRLQSELESKMSAKNVEDYAENVLGMKKMDSSQIKYIKTQTDDVVNIPEQKKGFFAKVKGFFESCVEYFRG